MLLKPSEARQKICPQMSLSTTGEFILCRAQRCVWWDWADSPRRQHRAGYAQDDARGFDESAPVPERPSDISQDCEWVPAGDGEPGRWVEPESQANERRRGYCGAAPPTGEL